MLEHGPLVCCSSCVPMQIPIFNPLKDLFLWVERTANLKLLLFTYFQPKKNVSGGYNNMEYPSLSNDWQTLEVFISA